ncbi:methyl-accepting chemotaxis protein [Undibacter mobilis]|uniref:Methyl-accepting chemotaxis protein n=1 Tax=Undibacter mobilis TaxID=2292256 RepID=A0A371B0L8_9BRAD|nr:methyl-accepting chemotaxis protein [Undibacter mobilis]RDV01074.1 methyl-accepting chemotaxis protein [Undibacter mobilis]
MAARLLRMPLRRDHRASSFSDIGDRAGRLSVEIADAAGLIGDLTALGQTQSQRAEGAIAAARQMAETNAVLSSAMTAARASADAAEATLRESSDHVSTALTNSIEKIEALGDGAIALKTTIEKVSATIQRVQETSAAVRRIADETELLALNATIEAAHAGTAGAGFAVIAGAVKRLAEQSRQSTKDAQAHLDTLTQTLSELVGRADVNTQTALAAKAESSGAQASIAELQALVETVQGMTREIGTMATQVDSNNECFDRLQEEMTGLVDAVDACGGKLKQAKARTDSILDISEDFLLFIAESGIKTPDTPIVTLCQKTAAQIASAFERAIAKGAITTDALFDERYVPIAGTDPQQMMTKFVAFTDKVLPDYQEPLLEADPRIVFCAAIDRNGFLPTHNLKYSQPQSDDPAWNAANCRNRRLFNDRTGLSAGRSKRSFLLQTYRRDMGGGAFVLMKDVSAPITVNGRHWGGFRIGFKV